MRVSLFLSLVLFAGVGLVAPLPAETPQAAAAPISVPGVLPAAEVRALMPPTVFFRGQSAPVQLRNSVGIRFGGGGLLLAGLVDNSGYASDVQERYQAYLLLDHAVTIEGHRLSPGAYGIGFLKPERFVVMDLSGGDVFVADAHRDQELRRPMPFQILPAAAGEFRLYAGRTFVGVQSAAQ